jgi:hypothetical protein
MDSGTSLPQKFRWRWIAVGVTADILGLLFVPNLNMDRHPFGTWMALVLFPYGMISNSPILWLAPLPVYGLALASFAQGRHWKKWCYAFAIFHTLNACLAAKMYYR